MSMLFSGFWAMAFAVLGGILLAMGTGLLGRWLLGIPAAVLAAPLRRLGAAGLLAATGLAANRWRTAALGDADRARRDARRHPGHRRVQQSAPHRGRDRACASMRRTSSSAPTERRCLPAPPPRSRGSAASMPSTAVVPTELYPLAGGLG